MFRQRLLPSSVQKKLPKQVYKEAKICRLCVKNIKNIMILLLFMKIGMLIITVTIMTMIIVVRKSVRCKEGHSDRNDKEQYP